MRVSLTAAGLMTCVAGAAVAQTHVGENLDGGLHWHVAAPGGASWALECRFRPITRTVNAYELRRWTNRIRQRGTGPGSGRLPVNNGRCTVTKVGGDGPVGIALVRGAEVVSDGVSGIGGQAYAGVL